MAIEIETSTDSVEQVKEALGSSVEIEESPTEESTEQPEEEKPSTEAAEEQSEEDENEEQSEEEPEEEAAAEKGKPAKKPAPDMVPRSRLNEEIRKRRAAEALLASEESDAEPEEETQSVQSPAAGQTYSGKPKPKLSDFTKGVDKFDAEAMAQAQEKFWEARETWADDEADAKSKYLRQQEKLQEAHQAKTADFVERRAALIEEMPEYKSVVDKSQVWLSAVMEEIVYESEVGPHMLYHFATHPKEARRIAAMGGKSQAKAMESLEAQLMEEYGVGEEKPEKKKTTTSVTPPPPKKASAAPPPATRLKSTGPQIKSDRELAGPEDRVGVDIVYSKELEQREKARRKA